MMTQHRRSDWHILVIESERDTRMRELILVDRPIYQTVAVRFGVIVVGSEATDEVLAEALRMFETEVIPDDRLPIGEYSKVLKQFPVPGLIIPEGLEFESLKEQLVWETGLCQEVMAENIEEIVATASKIDE